MEPKRDDFKKSGPRHLTAVDWEIPDHRRSIAASLVKGVYILERDRQKIRVDTESLAPLWWESFNFKLMHRLIDKNDSSIFGAIFESNFPIPPHFLSRGNPPKYVIAFRGTIPKRKTGVQDFNLDIHIFFNVLDKRSRAKYAIKAVEEIIDGTPPDDHPNIWLAGHSLGSALALLAGRNLVIEKGVCLETYLFNPPIASLPFERIKLNLLKKGSRVAISFVKYAASMALKDRLRQYDDMFEKLCEWKPHMFVNPRDAICAEYIGFFNNRDTMDEIGAPGIEKKSAKVSILSLLFKAVGKDLEQYHLIPAVYLNINKEYTKRAHGLEQWWQPNIHMWTKLYTF